MEVGFNLLFRFSLSDTTRKGRNLSPESAFFGFVDYGFNGHVLKIARPSERAISLSAIKVGPPVAGRPPRRSVRNYGTSLPFLSTCRSKRLRFRAGVASRLHFRLAGANDCAFARVLPPRRRPQPRTRPHVHRFAHPFRATTQTSPHRHSDLSLLPEGNDLRCTPSQDVLQPRASSIRRRPSLPMKAFLPFSRKSPGTESEAYCVNAPNPRKIAVFETHIRLFPVSRLACGTTFAICLHPSGPPVRLHPPLSHLQSKT